MNPYQPPSSPDPEHDTVRLAGFWQRGVAAVLDTVLGLVITMSAGIAVYGMEYLESDALVLGVFDAFISYVFPCMAYVFCWVRYGGTPGKLLVGIRVIDEATSGHMSVGKAIARYVLYLVSALPLLLGFLWMLWDKKRQCWHDKICGTIVVVR